LYKFRDARLQRVIETPNIIDDEKIPMPFKFTQDLSFGSLLKLFWKGVFFNLVNPMVLVYWISIVPLAGANKEYPNAVFIFFIGLLGTFFGIDILKIVLAKKLKHLLTPRTIRVINLVFSFGLIATGVYFVIKFLFSL
jgi:threonine/homoserine/homoserine lactone efflux protein